MGSAHVKGYAEMMVCMARAGKLTYEDMDDIMGFPSAEVKEATYAELQKIKPAWFEESIQLAEEVQKLIDGKNVMDDIKRIYIERREDEV